MKTISGVCRGASACVISDDDDDDEGYSGRTVHVHHPRRRAVLRGRQLGAVFLIFALLLVFVLLLGGSAGKRFRVFKHRTEKSD